MQTKTWLKKCILALIGSIVLFFVLCFVFDPYFHFHKPFSFVRYRLYDERYTNDGISRHFDYNAMITGTSMAQNFKHIYMMIIHGMIHSTFLISRYFIMEY